jgi:hypothetical protein
LAPFLQISLVGVNSGPTFVGATELEAADGGRWTVDP